MKSIIILPEWLITDARKKPIHRWGVRITGSEIVDIAPNSDLQQRYPDDKAWAAPNHW